MRILFVTSTRIGDAVLSTGLLAHLIERHPGARITVACGAVAAGLFAAMPGLERVIPIAKRRGGGHWLDLWRACVGRRWDLVVDLRASALAWLLLARERRVLRRDHGPTHRVRQLGAVLGLDPPPAPRLWSTPVQETAAEALVPAGAPTLALGPTANWPGKTWAASRFADLARRLTAADGILPGGRVAIFGGPGEEEMAAPVIAGLPTDRRIDLVGRIDLGTVHACLKRCALFVGNDSGLMHIAAASGIPTLGLFGPSREVHYAPWGPNAAVRRTPESYDALIGAPGYDHRATGSLMGGLTVDAVEAAAGELWMRIKGAAA
ncbi:MAG: glycosyltransferase family 9 protein [Alphaproteobacteria bacterium]